MNKKIDRKKFMIKFEKMYNLGRNWDDTKFKGIIPIHTHQMAKVKF